MYWLNKNGYFDKPKAAVEAAVDRYCPNMVKSGCSKIVSTIKTYKKTTAAVVAAGAIYQFGGEILWRLYMLKKYGSIN